MSNIGFLLHRAEQAHHILWDKNAPHGFDVTPAQFRVLQAVNDLPDPSQTQLVQTTNIDRSTIAGIVERLVKKGLLNRKRTKDDARAYAVRLTAMGERTLKEALRLNDVVTAEIVRTASLKEMLAVEKVLTRISESAAA